VLNHYGLSTLETIVADFGDNLRRKRRLRRQSPVLATVAELGDYSRQCGQAISGQRVALAALGHVPLDFQLLLFLVAPELHKL